MYSIACSVKTHTRLWRSTCGIHLICEQCCKPVSEAVVSERLTRAQLKVREPNARVLG